MTEGITAAERGFHRLLAVFKGLRGDVHDWTLHRDGVFIEFTLSGALGGKGVSWLGLDRFVLRDGRAIERVHYFDTVPLMLQAMRLPRAWLGLMRAGVRPRAPYLASDCVEPATDRVERSTDDRGWTSEFVESYAAHLAAPTAEGFTDFLAVGGHHLVPGVPPLADDDQGRERMDLLLGLLPDLHGRVVRWGSREEYVCIEATFAATVAGKTLHWPQVDRFRIRDGMVIQGRSFLDTFPIARRLRRSKRLRGMLSSQSAPSGADR